ncbi:hypothetical protein AMELA_G00243930 [Ameiurus melas]|uniref:Cystatin domain-containing protein n=1 Tax=Ameiurus melas TaxID=219545 RepID=A0A7J5ZSD2_AMEME|nr:hypothetical protein AMELA_G00243930 [Ameiurus melas]
MCTTTQMPGGWSEWKNVDQPVKKICELLKHEAESKSKKFPAYVPLNYRSQTVAGTNYEIKVFVGNDSCLFLSAFQGLGPEPKPVLKKTTVLPLPGISTH